MGDVASLACLSSFVLCGKFKMVRRASSPSARFGFGFMCSLLNGGLPFGTKCPIFFWCMNSLSLLSSGVWCTWPPSVLVVLWATACLCQAGYYALPPSISCGFGSDERGVRKKNIECCKTGVKVCFPGFPQMAGVLVLQCWCFETPRSSHAHVLSRWLDTAVLMVVVKCLINHMLTKTFPKDKVV